jgi:hypothetical protein
MAIKFANIFSEGAAEIRASLFAVLRKTEP